MSTGLSDNTKAILLLTAPLLLSKSESAVRPLTAREYGRLADALIVHGHQPSDLLTSKSSKVLEQCLPSTLDSDRLNRLLERGVLLGLALEHWQARAIWVISRADLDYPPLYKKRLKQNMPPVLYGCGDPNLLRNGGLAVVGSRKIADIVTEYANHTGQLAAEAQCTVISGGATGVDQAASNGALAGGGTTVIVLPANLEDAALSRKYRDALLDRRLALVSSNDPKMRWTVGRAMERNKLIYALSNVALIVESSYREGGTWPGAVEQLEKLRFVPVFARAEGEISAGLKGLLDKGAHPWPNPQTPDEFRAVLTGKQLNTQSDLLLDEGTAVEPDKGDTVRDTTPLLSEVPSASPETPAESIFAKAEELIGRMGSPVTESEVADLLQIEKKQATAWLNRLVQEGKYQKKNRPSRYVRFPMPVV